MTVAAGIPQLKRRIDDYIWREPSVPIQRLRNILDTHFMKFGSVAIVGGAVRDIARRGKVGFKSDIDLVIAADSSEVKELAHRLNAIPNRFGGYASHHPHWKIDFWALESTWAVTHGYANVHHVQDILNTTFFDCDAVCYELKTRKLYAPNNYLARLDERILDINLLPNPSIEGNLLRAIRRILMWGYHPGPKLSTFIEKYLTEERFFSIITTESQVFANIVVGEFERCDDLKRLLFSDRPKNHFNTAVSEQPMLPGFNDDD